MGKKKMPVVLVACMLLFSSLHVLAQRQNGVHPGECCFKFYTHLLPKNRVASFQRTNIHCAKDGVVFTMKNGRQLCVHPTQKWVQDVISYVESNQ